MTSGPAVIIEQKITKVNGEVAIKKYLRGELLGKGGFAKCYEATNLETKKSYAVKVIQKQSLNKNRAKQKLLSQIKIHKSLHHDYVVEFENCFEDTDHVYIFLELCTNKTLSEMLKKRKKLTVREVKYFMLQLLQAVRYMHSNRIIHRDLKMGNIFLNENMELKVGDFGLATKLEFAQQKKRTICGTPNYIAPEIIEGTVGHSYEVDVWSCGVICFALLFGKPPFETNQVKATYAKIKICKYEFPDSSIPDDAKDFIKRILVLDPKMRLTIDELFEHSFLKKQDDVPKYLPVQALTDVPTFKNTNNIDQVLKKKESSSSKLRPLDFGKRKPEEEFLGLCTSPRNMLNTDRNPNVTTTASLAVTQRFGQKLSEQKTVKLNNNFVQTSSTLQIEIYVVKHVDYSSKYGLGYILNNGHYGVYFNDSSKINFDPSIEEVTFIAKPEETKQQNIIKFNISNIPKTKDLQKKYSLLEHFKYYLDVELKNKTYKFEKSNKVIYMKQWLKTKHAIMFRLSNKVFQVDFLDGSQILLNTQKKMVTYTNKKNQRNVFTLNEALNSTETQMARRIKYTKQILNSIKKNNQQQPIQQKE